MMFSLSTSTKESTMSVSRRTVLKTALSGAALPIVTTAGLQRTSSPAQAVGEVQYYVTQLVANKVLLFLPTAHFETLTIYVESSTAGTITRHQIPAGSLQVEVTVTPTSLQTLTFRNENGAVDPAPWLCIDIFVDSRVSVAGSGSSAASPLKLLPSNMNSTYEGKTFGLAAGVEHYVGSPPSDTTEAILLSGKNIRFTTYNSTATAFTRAAKISASDTISGFTGFSTLLAGDLPGHPYGTANIRKYKIVDPAFVTAPKQRSINYWFRVAGERMVYTRTAPTNADLATTAEAPSVTTQLALFDNWSEGIPGIRWVSQDPANINLTQLANTQISQVKLTNNTNTPNNFTVRIRAPNFFAKAHAISTLSGAWIAFRSASNLTRLAQIVTYNGTAAQSGGGYVDLSISEWGEHAIFPWGSVYWSLVAHPMGLAAPGQMSWSANTVEGVWTAYVVPRTGVTATASNTRFASRPLLMKFNKAFVVDSNMQLTVADTAGKLAVSEPYKPMGGLFADSGSNLGKPLTTDLAMELGDIVGENISGYLDGGRKIPVLKLSSFSNTPISVGSVTVKGFSEASALLVETDGSGGPLPVTVGRIDMKAGGNGVWPSGMNPGPITTRNIVIPPLYVVHDNGINMGYQDVTSTTAERFAVSSVNPVVTQFNGTAPSNTNRKLINGLACDVKQVNGTGPATNYVIRIDNGLKGSLIDRVVAFGGTGNLFDQSNTNRSTGLIVQRSVIDRPKSEPSTPGVALSQVTFRYCVFLGTVGTSAGPVNSLQYVQQMGATVQNCVWLSAYPGFLTPEMVQMLTRSAAFDCYEDIPVLWADDLKLHLKAFGQPYTIQKPGLIAAKFPGLAPSGFHLATFANPNRVALTLPTGQGDNNLFDLWNGYGLCVKSGTSLPSATAKPNYVIVVDVSDTGASGSQTQRYKYIVPTS
jgi:hypothetical protein